MRMLARRRPRYAEVTATLALIVALGGTSYAVAALPRNSVGAKQLKRDAVNSSKVQDGSLTARDFAKGQLPAGATGVTGPNGVAGAKGADGARGPAGLSHVLTDFNPSGSFPLNASGLFTEAFISLSAGNYVIHGNIVFHNPNTHTRTMTCELVVNALGIPTTELDLEEVDLFASGNGSISATGTVSLGGPAVAALNCGQDAAPLDPSLVTFEDADLVAIAVDTID